MSKPLVEPIKSDELKDSSFDLTDRVNAECKHIDELLESICETALANRQDFAN